MVGVSKQNGMLEKFRIFTSKIKQDMDNQNLSVNYVALKPPYKIIKHGNKIGVQIGTQRVIIAGGYPIRTETHNYPVVAAENRITALKDNDFHLDESGDGEVWDDVETKNVSVLCDVGVCLEWQQFIKILWHDHARLDNPRQPINKVFIFQKIVRYNKSMMLPSPGLYTLHLRTETSEDGLPCVVRTEKDDVFALNVEWSDKEADLENRLIADLRKYLLILSPNRSTNFWHMLYETKEDRLRPLVDRLNANPKASSFRDQIMASFTVTALPPYEEKVTPIEPQNTQMEESVMDKISASIMEYVNNVNKDPEAIMSLGKLVAKAKFEWFFMKPIIRGLSEKWLMDKAIQIIVDTWNEYVSKKDDICYVKEECFNLKMLKHIFLEKDLKSVRDRELERREVNAKFNRMVSPNSEQEEKPKFNYTEETFKKSAMITDLQLDLVLAELIVMGLMPKTSSQSDFHKLFSGVTAEFFLIWTGKPAQLHDFFDMLTKKKEVKKKKAPGWVTPRGNYLNIVRSHFKDENNKWFGELNHERHIDGTNDILNKLEIVLAYSVDECINMMQTIVREHKDLLENIYLSVKPEHPSNFGRKSKSV